jgi:hypothetical protein
MSTASIRNCKFAFRCDRRWDDLIATRDPDVKFCGECQQEVFFCHTDAALADAIVRNRCIAIHVENHLDSGMPTIRMGSIRDIEPADGFGCE